MQNEKNEIPKLEIQRLLNIFVSKQTSQERAAKLLKVSGATLHNIKNGNFDLISDPMWRSIGKQVGLSKKLDWKIVPTTGFNEILSILEDAQETSSMFAFTAQEGAGKDTAIKFYQENNRNVFIINCSEYFNRKTFLAEILESMGVDNTGTVAQMVKQISTLALRMELPVLIFNEADKLNDHVLHFLISFYNKLENRCAIILTATDTLSKKIQRGRSLRKPGYAELYSRMGRRIIEIEGTTKEEIKAICEVNGVKDANQITHIYNEYEGDLRRVYRMCFKFKKQLAK